MMYNKLYPISDLAYVKKCWLRSIYIYSIFNRSADFEFVFYCRILRLYSKYKQSTEYMHLACDAFVCIQFIVSVI